ncbi:TetR/AcrR family transcriptional regulator [Nonomuraea turkmeniaca]|uniref:TetR/AcrR family transcriptional regulator n=1 Tax=Nonomuraea turkmeniaca TaxID=103838 RepID=A0A5S4FU21_9ACTN|nr:TetR/AcrR family transcriptional regulator [Nonomuraea turkmeniaca]
MSSVNSYCVTDSRSSLLTAAAEEFARHGLQGTRVHSIVKRAGINERMIYHHFGNKDGLYAAVLKAQMEDLAEAWRPIIARGVEMEPYAGMRSVLAGFAGLLLARPQLTALLLHEALAGWPTEPLPTADMLPAPLRDLYARGQSTGAFRADCPFEIAYGTALCALITLPMFVPRFAEVLGPDANVVTESLRDQMVGQLLDGMTGPLPEPRR